MQLDRKELLNKWSPLLEGIDSQDMAYQTARLFENQAKAFMAENMKASVESIREEAITTGSTTVGKLSTYQKWAFPMIRRMYPELIFNKIGATQAMDGPVGQIFYMGNSRVYNNLIQTQYSKFRITPQGLVASAVGSTSAVSASVQTAGFNTLWGNQTNAFASALTHGTAVTGFDLSNVIRWDQGSASATMGGRLAAWPVSTTILGWSVSAGERLRLTGIPEITMHIQKQTVQTRTRKMRALWTLEAAQDLKAYHNLDMESELTELLSKEMNLEIDRELIEDIRMLAYGFNAQSADPYGGWYLKSLYNGNADNFPNQGGVGPDGVAFTPAAFNYDFANDGFTALTTEEDSTQPAQTGSNVYVIDLARFANTSTSFAPQHLGHVFSNVLAIINFASQDIYKTTLRGPGTVLITSPLIASMLESAAKLEGGLQEKDGPSNQSGNAVKYVGKFAGKYDMIVDPLFPDDEIIVAYKGTGSMDAGLFYCPYIPIESLPTVTDPETFQPRKGIMTRYGKVAIQPASRFFRVVRLIGTGTGALTPEVMRQTKFFSSTALGY